MSNYREKFLAHHGEPPYKCFVCGDDVWLTNLLVHHLDQDRKNHDLENLVAGHYSCHAQWHQHNRRPIDPKDRRETYIQVRVSFGEKYEVKAKADALNIAVSEYIRRAILDKPEGGSSDVPDEDLKGIKDPVARDMLRTWNPVSSLR